MKPEEIKYSDDERRFSLELFARAVKNEPLPGVPAGIVWENLLSLCRGQKTAAAAFLPLSGAEGVPQSALSAFGEAYDIAVNRELLFRAEREKITRALNERRVPHLLIKGASASRLYPAVGMREYFDNDILIEKDRAEEVRKLMLGFGYEYKSGRGPHDVYYKQPIYNFEFHTALFPPESPFSAYYDDIWSKAERVGGEYSYELGADDQYICLLAHLKKHCDESGAGARAYADIYLSRGRLADPEYVGAELEKLGLTGFESETLGVCGRIFEGGEPGRGELIRITDSGAYGSFRQREEKMIRSRGKAGYLFYMLFLPYGEMKKKYPILNGAAFLLPVFWVYRLLRFPFTKSKRDAVASRIRIAKNYKNR